MSTIRVLFLLLIAFPSFGQKCYDYPPIKNIKGDTIYAFKECGKPWTIFYPDKAISSIVSTGSKLFVNYVKTSDKMDSLASINKAILKKAFSLTLAWMVMLNSYQADAQNKGFFFQYINIPSAPTLSSPTTIIPSDFCCGAGVFNFTLLPSPPADGKTSGNFINGFSLRQFDGTAAHEYRFVNTAGDIYGAAGGSENGIGTTNSGNWLRLYGLNATNPMVCKGNIGVQLPSATIASGGFNGTVQNVVIKSCTNSGVTANYTIIGTQYYENVLEQFVRVFNAGQEGIMYAGNTGSSYDGTNYLNYLTVTNNFNYNSSREGIQGEHINHWSVTHNTCILSGQTGGSSQDNSLQGHDLGPGSLIQYNIFDGSPTAFNIFTHGTTISNNYFAFSANKSFIGRTDNSYFSTSSRLTNDSLIFDGDYFIYTGGGSIAFLTDIAERKAPIIFRNCKFQNITAIWNDIRVAGYTNTITGNIGDHGNTSVTVTAPVYVAGYNDPDNYASQGLLATSSPYYSLHYGYRTP